MRSMLLPPLLVGRELPRELVGVEGGREPGCLLGGVAVFLTPWLVSELELVPAWKREVRSCSSVTAKG